MVNVERETFSGEGFVYSEHDVVIVNSPFGMLLFEEVVDGVAKEFMGKLQPFEVREVLKEDSVYEDVEFEVFMDGESVYMPIREVDNFEYNTAFVIDDSLLVKIGNEKALRPELCGGEKSNQVVLEVYEFAYPRPFDVSSNFDCELVLGEDVSRLFKEQDVVEVYPIE